MCASISVCCSNSTKRLVSPPTRVNITFVDRDGDVQVVRGRIGDTLLEVAREYDIDLEGVCICSLPLAAHALYTSLPL